MRLFGSSALALVSLAAALVCCGSSHGAPAANPTSEPASSAPPPQDDTSATGASSAAAEPSASPEPAAEAPPQPEPKFCEHDADCTLSTFSGCCTCCANVAHAFLRAKLANLQARCAKTICPPCDKACGAGPDMSAYLAVCQNKQCIAVPQ